MAQSARACFAPARCRPKTTPGPRRGIRRGDRLAGSHARSSRPGRPARSGAGDDQASQPCRVHEHHPRPAGHRVQRRRRFPLRRRGLRVRQHRRRAHAPADADGEVSECGRANRRQGHRHGQAGRQSSGLSGIAAPDSFRRTGSELVARRGRRADSAATRHAGLPPPDRRRGTRPPAETGRNRSRRKATDSRRAYNWHCKRSSSRRTSCSAWNSTRKRKTRGRSAR